MTATATLPDVTPLPALDGGPHDVEFFFDPGCPFAWQTSVWIRRVIELLAIKVGWRFISLAHINAGKEKSSAMEEAHQRGRAYHRICAAARRGHGNDAVGALYRAYGEAFWYRPVPGEGFERHAAAAAAVDVPAILERVGLPADLVGAAGDPSYDALLAAESEEAFRRTGPDVGTPILTYDPPSGNSLFGPVISSVPDDDTAVAFYHALRTFVDFPAFSELKRSERAPLDLPLLRR